MRWGILGTGVIAGRFVEALQSISAVISAVGSRSEATAKKFAEQYSIGKYHGSYDGLASDPDVDVVYIATPHLFHHRDALLCLERGKHLLIEKAFTINATEAKQIIDKARERNVFVMEAMWSRFFPAMSKVKELIASGVIGDVQQGNCYTALLLFFRSFLIVQCELIYLTTNRSIRFSDSTMPSSAVARCLTLVSTGCHSLRSS